MSEDGSMTEDAAIQKVKFYQTGTHTVGNRLMDESGRGAGVDGPLQRHHLGPPGLPGLRRGARRPLRARRCHAGGGGKLVAVNATGCLEVFTTPYPETSWQIPWLHSLFGNAPAVGAGVAAGLRPRGRRT